MLDHLLRAYAYNINVRIADEGRHDFTRLLNVREVGVDIPLGVVASGASAASAAPPMDPIVIRPTDANGVTITAILVQHAPVFPALAYRFDTPAGSVVFSGDTGPCDNVVRLAPAPTYSFTRSSTSTISRLFCSVRQTVTPSSVT